MRLGADAIVFSRSTRSGYYWYISAAYTLLCLWRVLLLELFFVSFFRKATQSVGLLSYTFLRRTGQDDVIVPMVKSSAFVDFLFMPETNNSWDCSQAKFYMQYRLILIYPRSGHNQLSMDLQKIGLPTLTFFSNGLHSQQRMNFFNRLFLSKASLWILHWFWKLWFRVMLYVVLIRVYSSFVHQFDDIGTHGTKIIIYNLWLNDEGIYELSFDDDDEVTHTFPLNNMYSMRYLFRPQGCLRSRSYVDDKFYLLWHLNYFLWFLYRTSGSEMKVSMMENGCTLKNWNGDLIFHTTYVTPWE